MRSFKTRIIVLVFVLFIASSWTTVKEYSGNGISLKYPGTWELTTSIDEGVYSVVIRESHGLIFHVSLIKTEAELDDVITTYTSNIREASERFGLINISKYNEFIDDRYFYGNQIKVRISENDLSILVLCAKYESSIVVLVYCSAPFIEYINSGMELIKTSFSYIPPPCGIQNPLINSFVTPQEDAVQCYNKGLEYYKSSSFDEAIVEFEKALGLEPTNATYLFDYSRALEDAGHASAAMYSYQLFIKYAPTDDPKLTMAEEHVKLLWINIVENKKSSKQNNNIVVDH